MIWHRQARIAVSKRLKSAFDKCNCYDNAACDGSNNQCGQGVLLTVAKQRLCRTQRNNQNAYEERY